MKHQANRTEMLGRIADMEIQQEQANSNIDQLYNNQEIIVTKVDQEGTSVPGAISTSGETAFSANESQAKMIREHIAAAMNEYDTPRRNPRGKTGAVWKQWKFWCCTCGVSISHDTAGHTGDKTKVECSLYKWEMMGKEERTRKCDSGIPA